MLLLGKLSFLCWLDAESINLLTQSAREPTRSRRQKVVRAAVHSSTDQGVSRSGALVCTSFGPCAWPVPVGASDECCTDGAQVRVHMLAGPIFEVQTVQFGPGSAGIMILIILGLCPM